MLNHEPDVSVIIPTFNSEKFIQESIDSVLAQEKVSVEIIIVDAGSTDSTVKIVEQYILTKKNIRIIHNIEDEGPAHARLIGVTSAKGEYVAFLDSDDVWLPSKLRRQVDVMKERGWGFTYCLYGSDPARKNCFYSAFNEYSFWKAIFFRGIATFTVVVKRSLLTANVMKFYPNQFAEDYLWWILLIKNGVVPRLVPFYGGYYRRHENARSVNLGQNLKSVNFYLDKELGIPKYFRILIFIVYPLDVFVRKLRYKSCLFFHNLLDLL